MYLLCLNIFSQVIVSCLLLEQRQLVTYKLHFFNQLDNIQCVPFLSCWQLHQQS